MVKLCVDIHSGISVIEVSNISFPGYKGQIFEDVCLKFAVHVEIASFEDEFANKISICLFVPLSSS